MKNVYSRPVAEVISFAPSKAIAMENPDWGWEDDVFGESTPETRSIDDERREDYEG